LFWPRGLQGNNKASMADVTVGSNVQVLGSMGWDYKVTVTEVRIIASPPASPRLLLPPYASLTVTSIVVSPSVVSRGQPFTVTLVVKNEGDAPSGLFVVEVHARAENLTGTTDYAIGSDGRLKLEPGQSVEFKYPSAPDGVNQTDTYKVHAFFRNLSG